MSTERLKALLAEYGPIAMGTYLVLFVIVLLGFVVAIQAGFEVESATGGASVLGAAWVAAKVTQPLRILATLVLTPFVARGLARFGLVKRRSEANGPAAEG